MNEQVKKIRKDESAEAVVYEYRDTGLRYLGFEPDAFQWALQKFEKGEKILVTFSKLR